MQAPGLNTPGPDGSYASAHSSEPGHHDCLDDWSRHVFLFGQLGWHAAQHSLASVATARSSFSRRRLCSAASVALPTKTAPSNGRRELLEACSLFWRDLSPLLRSSRSSGTPSPVPACRDRAADPCGCCNALARKTETAALGGYWKRGVASRCRRIFGLWLSRFDRFGGSCRQCALEVELGRPGRRVVVAAIDYAGGLGGGEGQTLLRHRLDSVKPLQSLRQFISGKFQMDYSSRLGSHAGRRCMKQ